MRITRWTLVVLNTFTSRPKGTRDDNAVRARAVPADRASGPACRRGSASTSPSFRSRHRIISAVLVVHVPALAAIGLVRGVSGWLLWGQLAAIVVAFVLGQVLSSQVARASAVSLGLMIGADVLVHVGGGLTDLHIWFYACSRSSPCTRHGPRSSSRWCSSPCTTRR